MAVKFLNTKETKRFLVLIGICLSILLSVIFYFPNYTKRKTLRNGNADIKKRNAELEQEIKDLEDKLERVGKDPFLYESIARDQLGVAKENEMVIDIKE